MAHNGGEIFVAGVAGHQLVKAEQRKRRNLAIRRQPAPVLCDRSVRSARHPFVERTHNRTGAAVIPTNAASRIAMEFCLDHAVDIVA